MRRQMEIQPSLSIIYSSSKSKTLNCKTHFAKPFKTLDFALSSYSRHTNLSPSLYLKSATPHSHRYNPNQPHKSIKQTTLFVEKYHVTQQFLSLIQKLKGGNLSPSQILEDDGDWNKNQFWAVIKFLQQTSRFEEIPEVFNAWIKREKSRINEVNYNKIIGLLSEAEMMEEAALELQNMKNYGLHLCSEVYNSIIHGYAQKGKLDDALHYLNEMEEANLSIDTETYDGLIKAYGKLQMYDEMVKCLKTMESSGISPDHITYNLLIRELSKGGLLKRMERMYQTLISKKMDLQSSTLVAMLEAYADFGVLDKMERFYLRVKNSKTLVEEGLMRKIARVYIENYMFSRLHDLGNDVGLKTGRTDLFWCLHLLCHACLLSKKGMNSVIQEMEEAGVSWNVTVVNVISLSYLKMKDFKHLSITLIELPRRRVKPDIVTFGILYDAHNAGFDWSSTLKTWKKFGYLENGVEMNTDPLVFTAFGKGLFLRTIEEVYTLLEHKAREEQRWTYDSLVNLVLKHHGHWPNLAENDQLTTLNK